MRQATGLTVEQVAERLLCSPSKISRLETGQRGASPRDIRDLSELYQVTDPDQRQYLATLAREGKEQAWWQSYDLPHSTYIGLEDEAVSIRIHHASVVPGLLQIPQYARAVYEAAMPRLAPEALDQQLEARLTRQHLLTKENPPQVLVVLDESVLHRIVGGPAVMRAQIERITEVSHLPNVTVRVIPYRAGALPGVHDKFIILGFSAEAVSDIVFVEGLVGDLYLERQADVSTYHQAFRALCAIALSPDETNDLITKIGNDYEP
jgi:transcriptional regulator with XRE-family HTH domain